MLRIGYHPPLHTTGDFIGAISRSIKNGANSGQIWTGNPKGYKVSLHGYKVTDPIKMLVESEDYWLISHSPYILNFARDVDDYVLERYRRDLINITRMGGVGSVLHMGFNVKNMNKTHEAACRTFVDNLENIAVTMPKDSTIILENLAGKGTAMCCRMKEWGEFWNDFIDESLQKRVKWCVDTAHLWGVGEYNLSKRRQVKLFLEDFDENIGWENLLCFHYNGSKADIGSCKDLHADIDNNFCGNIESKGMRYLARWAYMHQKPLIMEIPAEAKPVHEQISIVKAWINK